MARAMALIDEAAPDTVRYAALELRLCIEELTYEKLRAMSSTIPEDILSTWQPPQAIKALLEFEPSADRSFTLFAGIEETPGVESKDMKYVGRHTALRFPWLRKHYNKLGNLLHAAPPGAVHSMSHEQQIAYLKEVVSDLTEPLSGNITGGSLRTVFGFECVRCKKQVVNNKDAVTKTRKAVCLNPQCGAQYFARVSEEGEASFTLMVTEFDCAKCESLIPVENRTIDIGTTFTCPSCKTEHQVVNRQWLYEPK